MLKSIFVGLQKFAGCGDSDCKLNASSIIKVILLSALSEKNVSFDMFAQRRLKSACASAQSDQFSLSAWLHDETLQPWLSKMRQVKILIRLGEWPG